MQSNPQGNLPNWRTPPQIVEHREYFFGIPELNVGRCEVIFRRDVQTMSSEERPVIAYHWAICSSNIIKWETYHRCARDVAISRLSNVELSWSEQPNPLAALAFVEGMLTVYEGMERYLRFCGWFNAMRQLTPHIKNTEVRAYLQQFVDQIPSEDEFADRHL